MTLRLLHLPAAASPWVRLARRPREPHPSQVERGLLSPCSTPGVWEAAILGRLGQLPTSQATMREGLGLRDRPDGCLEPCSTGSPPCWGGEDGGVQFPLKSVTFAHIRSHPGVRPSYHRQMAGPLNCGSRPRGHLLNHTCHCLPGMAPRSQKNHLSPSQLRSPRKCFLGRKFSCEIVIFSSGEYFLSFLKRAIC